MRYVVLSSLLFLVGISLTQLKGDEQTYVPIVRMRTNDGHFVTMLANRPAPRKLCNEMVEHFAAPLRACPSCSIESMECTKELLGVDKLLAEGGPLPIHTVVGDDGVRMSVVGPPETIVARCQSIAQHMVKGGMKSAYCVYPKPAAPAARASL